MSYARGSVLYGSSFVQGFWKINQLETKFEQTHAEQVQKYQVFLSMKKNMSTRVKKFLKLGL